VFFVLYLQFENNVLSPLVVGKSVDLSPPATMTAALVGVSAGGVVGALVAVPLLGAAKAVYLELAPLVDVLSCPAEGLRLFYDVQEDDPAPAALERFDLQAVVMTSRTELGMWRNRVGATVVARGPDGGVETHHDREREVEIVDRLGAGDAFLSGFLYGLLTDAQGALAGAEAAPDWARATAYGGACAALKHSIRGDFPILTAPEVRQEIESPALRVQR
jgi:2-dehydro-3-deoxygluconokinase